MSVSKLQQSGAVKDRTNHVDRLYGNQTRAKVFVSCLVAAQQHAIYRETTDHGSVPLYPSSFGSCKREGDRQLR